jgi:hypothetical protein
MHRRLTPTPSFPCAGGPYRLPFAMQRRGQSPSKSAGFKTGGVPWNVPTDDSQPLHVDADVESRQVDPVFSTGLEGTPLKVQKIDFVGGIQFNTVLAREIPEALAKNGRFLGWLRLLLGLLYGAAGIAFLFVVIFVTDGKFSLFWDPIRYSSLASQWQTALERAGVIHIDWGVVAIFFVCALYHPLHFIPFIRDVYIRLVFFYQVNVIRWVFHGIVGGLLMGFFSVVMGVSSVIVFILLLVILIGAAACILFSEMINRPDITWLAKDEQIEDATVAKFRMTTGEVAAARKNGYYVTKGSVTPWPILAAIVLALTFMGITSAYFWNAVADEANRVPWYVWITYAISMVTLVVIGVYNTLCLVLNYAIFRNYFWNDIIHNVVEVMFIFGGGCLLLIGLATAA